MKDIEPRRIASFGSASIYSAILNEPWKLPIEAFVIPTGPTGDLQGGLAQALREAGASDWLEIERRFKLELSKESGFGPDYPIFLDGITAKFSKARLFIFATGVSQTLDRTCAGEATETVIQRIPSYGVSSLGLPLLGSGRAGIASPEVTAKIMFEALSRTAAESALENVYITTLSRPAFTVLQRLGDGLNKAPTPSNKQRRVKKRPPLPGTTSPAEQASDQGAVLRPAVALVEEFLSSQQYALDLEARELIAFAGHIASERRRQRDGSGQLTTSTLFFAMIDRGRVPDEDPRSAALRLLARAVIKDPDAYSTVRADYLSDEPPRSLDTGSAVVADITRNVRTVLSEAGKLQRAAGAEYIGTAALVLSLLSNEDGHFRNHLKSLSLERVALERQLTQELSGLLLPMQPLPNFWTDNPNASTEDYLDLRKEVQAFAYLAAGNSIEPPLSIGIFGEWGSGKTFFMERMHDLVAEITRKGSEYQNTGKFHEGIVQIRFNAWHYIESNLWASLVEFIFHELDRWLSENGEDRRKIDALFDQLATSKQLRLDAVRDLLASRRNLEDAKTELTKARKAYDEALRARATITQRDIWTVVWESFIGEASRSTEIKEAALNLGLPHLGESQAGLRKLVEDSRAQGSRARLLGQSLLARLGSPGAIRAIIAILAVPLVLEGLRLALAYDGWAWLKEFNAGVLAATSFLGAIIVTGRVLLNRGIEAMNVLDRFRMQLDERVAAKTAEEQESLMEEERKVSETHQAVGEAERRVTSATNLASAAELEYAADTARGRLNKFIRDKVADGSYAKHLGIIATIRRDFDQLAKIMQSASPRDGESGLENVRKLYRDKLNALLDVYNNKHTKLLNEKEVENLLTEPEQKDLPFFRRIILYIDDLDRCPPEKVTEVLQAIHMLLFFPLFVVVVAVDARWIARSLETEFPHLLREAKEGTKLPEKPAGPAVERDENQPRTHSRKPIHASAFGRSEGETATAQDYLEKIFQIPFWVRPMDKDASKAFVLALTSRGTADVAGDSSKRGQEQPQQRGALEQPGLVQIEQEEQKQGAKSGGQQETVALHSRDQVGADAEDQSLPIRQMGDGEKGTSISDQVHSSLGGMTPTHKRMALETLSFSPHEISCWASSLLSWGARPVGQSASSIYITC